MSGSGLFFPALSGQGWSTTKTPVWNTKVQTAVSGRELRASYYQNCRYKFTLMYEVLNAGVKQDLQNLMGFFNNMQGSFQDFFYIDPSDNLATNANFGTGDGATTAFILTRPLGGSFGNGSGPAAFDPVLLNTNQNFTIQVGGSTVTNYTVSLGVGNLTTITFSTPPMLGAALTWSGQYMFRCRFQSDSVEFENFMYQLWSLNKLEMITVK
jgi:uncharacterized protein (TIGR02217 family)